MGPPHSPRHRQARDGPTPVRPLHIPGQWANQQRHCHPENSRLGTPSGTPREGLHHHDVQNSSWSCWHPGIGPHHTGTCKQKERQCPVPPTIRADFGIPAPVERPPKWGYRSRKLSQLRVRCWDHSSTLLIATSAQYAPVPWGCRHIQPHTHSTRYPRRVLYYIGRRRTDSPTIDEVTIYNNLDLSLGREVWRLDRSPPHISLGMLFPTGLHCQGRKHAGTPKSVLYETWSFRMWVPVWGYWRQGSVRDKIMCSSCDSSRAIAHALWRL